MLLISSVSIGKPLGGGFFGHDCSEKCQEQSVVSNRLAGEGFMEDERGMDVERGRTS